MILGDNELARGAPIYSIELFKKKAETPFFPGAL
jgi:hypothetical protein